MKNRKMLLSLLLICFCLITLVIINNQAPQDKEEELFVKKFEMANEQLDNLLLNTCSSVIKMDELKEGEVQNAIIPKPEIELIATEFKSQRFKTFSNASNYHFAFVRLESKNSVLLKYDVSNLTLFLFLKKDPSGKFIQCHGKSFFD